MSQQISLKDAERKVFQSTFADGLWDVFLGCSFPLQLAIGPFLSRSMGDFWSSAVFHPLLGGCLSGHLGHQEEGSQTAHREGGIRRSTQTQAKEIQRCAVDRQCDRAHPWSHCGPAL